MVIRLAYEEDLQKVNVLRRQVNQLHVEGKPDVFKPGFPDKLRDYIQVIFRDPEQWIVIACEGEDVCGFAVLHHIVRPESPFMYERNFLDVDEFCVDSRWRRRGVGTQLMDFIRAFAREKNFHRIELNMWEFNQDALAFYEAAGFTTFRRYMEMYV
ncbi:MAG: GNAT family N-acetyltransferase [Clostridia bacterium]|nr:GNAT family N-acetyltransferase [Clostridia bacterium]